MEYRQLIHDRFSILEYERRDVAPELVRTILEAGLAAPVACNFQPQRIKVIDDDASRAALGRVVPSRYYVPLAFLVCFDRRECWVRPMDAALLIVGHKAAGAHPQKGHQTSKSTDEILI